MIKHPLYILMALLFAVYMLGCNRVKQSAPKHIDVSHTLESDIDSSVSGGENSNVSAIDKIDTDGDGKISTAEAEEVLVLKIGKIDTDVLLELHRFPNLERLEIREVDAPLLDLSKNRKLKHLICCGCNISSLDLSKNVALEYVDCSSNQLTTLDVSKNTSLDNLYCDYNPLTTLYVAAGHKFGHLSIPEDATIANK